MTFEEAKKIAAKLDRGELNIDQLKAEFERVIDNKETIVADLNKLKIADLLKYTWKDGRKKKKDYVKSIYQDLLHSFRVSDGFLSYSPFEGQTLEGQLKKAVEEQTQADIDQYVAKQKAKREAREKAIANPTTRAEFETFARIKGMGALTPELRARWEALIADGQLADQEREDERKRTISKADLEGTEMSLHTTVHTKHGHNLWVVKLADRISKDAYRALNSKAKRLGGNYSSYARDGAIPGFQFRTEDAAKQFMELQEGSVTKESKADEKAARVGDKLRDMADRWEEQGREKLNQPRLTNTHRRARMASHAEADALTKIHNANLMRAIADAMDKGDVKYLSKLTSWSQLEELLSLLRQATWRRFREENTPLKEQEPNAVLDIPYAHYPYPSLHISQFNKIGANLQNVKGFKMMLTRMAKNWPRNKDKSHAEIAYYTKEGSIDNLRKIINSRWGQNEFKYHFLPESIQRYDRLQRMGIAGPSFLRTALRELAEIKKGTSALSPEEKRELELKQAEREFIGLKEKGFFPTPSDLAATIVQLAEIEPGMKVLEPSAGLGHLAAAITEAEPDIELDVVEQWHAMRQFLTKKGYNVVEKDIFDLNIKQYDRIVMNPPFENLADIDHVRHAFTKLLKPGGRLVAIMAANKEGTRTKVKEFKDFVDEYGYSIQNEPNAFKSAFRSTAVNTITVVLDKPEGEVKDEPAVESVAKAPDQTKLKLAKAKAAAQAQRLRLLNLKF